MQSFLCKNNAMHFVITFLIKGNKALTSPDFSLKDIPGSGGRMDIMCRCLTSSLLVSHGIRKNIEVFLCFEGEPNPPRCVRVHGDQVRHLSPDERSTAIIIQKALRAYMPGKEIESTPGVFISDTTFSELVERFKERLIVLDENGEKLTSSIPFDDPCFVLGDHMGFSKKEEELLAKAKLKISVSPLTLHASHCIVLVLHALDEMKL